MLRLRANEGFIDLKGFFLFSVGVHNRRCCRVLYMGFTQGPCWFETAFGRVYTVDSIGGAFGLNARALISRLKVFCFFTIWSRIVIVRSTGGPQGIGI